MSFVDQLKTEANYTHTMNGAKTHGSSGDACLDFFAVAGGMRYRKKADQIRLFDRAYIETPDLAMKLLFHLRDIRGGMGERQMFRTLLRHASFNWPESARKNVPYIAEYGRWDDMLCLLGTPVQDEAVQTIRKQLEKDIAALLLREAGHKDAHISLLAKWMPSINTSSQKTCALARKLARALDMDELTYRQTLTRLRTHIGLTERYLTQQRPEKIQYEAVPGGAMLKYRQAFDRHDGKRFSAYLSDAACGHKTIHADTLFPYEILRPFFRGSSWGIHGVHGEKALEALWNSLPSNVGNINALSVIDTSGSMYWTEPQPALISQAMGLYCAERCKGVFHNKFLTFESQPHLMQIHGKTLADKLRYIGTAPVGGSTNLEAVFDLILRTAVKARAKQNEMPSVLYIFSDMEFDAAISNPSKTVYENAREKFLAAGYELPAVVFHNVNSWQMQVPVTAHTRGAALSSGASISAVREKFDGNVTPMSHMLRVLNGKRYEPIHA